MDADGNLLLDFQKRHYWQKRTEKAEKSGDERVILAERMTLATACICANLPKLYVQSSAFGQGLETSLGRRLVRNVLYNRLKTITTFELEFTASRFVHDCSMVAFAICARFPNCDHAAITGLFNEVLGYFNDKLGEKATA